MKYMGSKNRIAKYILPIMLKEAEKNGITRWVEPFVGGGNMIDKVPSSFTREGYDLNGHAIHALIDIRDNLEILPDSVSESEYLSVKGSPPGEITSIIRFGCSFGGKFEGGFARGISNSGAPRNYWMETIRNTKRQSPYLQGVDLICADFLGLSFQNSLIYCDPPYQGTTSYKTGSFPHEEFFAWCREQAKKNIVFVSEYTAPDDFIEVWRGEVKTNFASSRKGATHNAIEKLYRVP